MSPSTGAVKITKEMVCKIVENEMVADSVLAAMPVAAEGQAIRLMVHLRKYGESPDHTHGLNELILVASQRGLSRTCVDLATDVLADALRHQKDPIGVQRCYDALARFVVDEANRYGELTSEYRTIVNAYQRIT